MPTDVDAIVIGAGISGLVTAFRLQQLGIAVEVIETAAHAGGVMGTRHRDGFLYETGPNSALDSTPLIAELLTDLGIADQRRDASKAAATRYVVRDGKLMALPSSPREFLASDTFSRRAKLRLLREPFIARGPAGVEESIADFTRRRLGQEFLDYGVDPFVAGIYAGDPERLSVPAAFPRLLALETQHGSLIKGQISGARARRESGPDASKGHTSFSFADGMQTLPDALARTLAHGVHYAGHATSVTRRANGTYAIEGTLAGAPLARRARAVVLAVPAGVAATIVPKIAPAAAQALAAIEYAPIVIAASAYKRADIAHSLAGFGFLVPKKERRRILGALFSSSMFPGRAPSGSVLLTTFIGGRRNPELPACSDAELRMLVQEELAALLGASHEPVWTDLTRWTRAIPQYDIGHPARIAAIDAAAAQHPGLYFCANYRGGVAMGDCIKAAHATADAVAAFLRPAARRD